jgi:hypothetical protein
MPYTGFDEASYMERMKATSHNDRKWRARSGIKKMKGICVLRSDFPLLLLCRLFLRSFGFFRHYSSLKLQFVDLLFEFLSVTKRAR